jgi:hypothetical protein
VAKEHSSGMMVTVIQENTMLTNVMAKVNKYGVMVTDIKVNGLMD